MKDQLCIQIFMKIIFIHKIFPGQFKHLVGALLKLGHEIISISPSKVSKYSGVKHITYQAEKGNSLDAHTLIHETETKVIRDTAVAKEAYNLKESGYIPNLIIGILDGVNAYFCTRYGRTCHKIH